MSVVRIPVYWRGKIHDYALVDAADDERFALSSHRWHAEYGKYAINWKLGRMHRLIVGLAKGDPRAVHHINENPLDNRRENLGVFANMSLANMQPHPQRDARTMAAIHEYLRRQQRAAA